LSRAIAAPFGVPHSFLKEAIKHLVVVRNIAAHHGRLWDREISAYTLPRVRKNPRELKEAMERATHPQKLFRTLSLLLLLMKNLGQDGEWRGRLFDVLSQYGPYLEERMGFPPGFRGLTLWQGMP
ncbi:MAG: Abi family protein, partial [Methanothrix sp.]